MIMEYFRSDEQETLVLTQQTLRKNIIITPKRHRNVVLAQ